MPSQSVPSNLSLIVLPNDVPKDPLYCLTQGVPPPGGGDVPDRCDDVQDYQNSDIPPGPLPTFRQRELDAQAQAVSKQTDPSSV